LVKCRAEICVRGQSVASVTFQNVRAIADRRGHLASRVSVGSNPAIAGWQVGLNFDFLQKFILSLTTGPHTTVNSARD